jgi:hypothetical protein
MHRLTALGPIAVACALALSACGGSAKTTSHPTTATKTPARPATGLVSDLTAAEQPNATDFPAAGGKSLQQLASLATSQVQFGPATGTYTPGMNRVAFALTSSSNEFVYAPTALYIAKSPSAPAQGPFLAPADPVGVPSQYRSAQNSAPGGLKAIFAAQLPLSHPGTYDVLVLAKTPSGMVGGTGVVAAAVSSPIPAVGQAAPHVATDTLATVHGNLSLLTTRTPPESMHSVSLTQVLGKRPVALLFSTPELCTSRVCGPVTDVIASLQHQFAGRIAFIHEEVYVGNDPHKGLRPQLKDFHLETEPWLFTINARGVITARLEGTFGVTEARKALQTALG